MATNWTTRTGTHAATAHRSRTGRVLTMATTRAAHQDQVVEADNTAGWTSLGELLASETARNTEVVWQTAASLNQTAAELENHRHADLCAESARQLREQARQAARAAMTVVN